MVLEAPLSKVETQKFWCNIPNECVGVGKSQEISNPHLKPFSVESRKTSRGAIPPPPPTSNRVKEVKVRLKRTIVSTEGGSRTLVANLPLSYIGRTEFKVMFDSYLSLFVTYEGRLISKVKYVIAH